MRRGLFAVVLLVGIAHAAVAQTAEDLARCRDIVDANERLRCYDALARTVLPPPATSPSEPPKPAPLDRDDPRAALVPTGRTGDGRSLLSQRWELDREDKYGAFQFTYYRPNYILPALWSTDVNRMPESPTRAALPLEIPYQSTEGAFQLSFKIKMAEEVFGTGSDIWIGYTQQSYWQVYNDDLSRPFRETNYEPEVMWVVPTTTRSSACAGDCCRSASRTSRTAARSRCRAAGIARTRWSASSAEASCCRRRHGRA